MLSFLVLSFLMLSFLILSFLMFSFWCYHFWCYHFWCYHFWCFHFDFIIFGVIIFVFNAFDLSFLLVSFQMLLQIVSVNNWCVANGTAIISFLEKLGPHLFYPYGTRAITLIIFWLLTFFSAQVLKCFFRLYLRTIDVQQMEQLDVAFEEIRLTPVLSKWTGAVDLMLFWLLKLHK